MGGSILGAAVKRVEDPRFITGRGDYLSDMSFEGMLWMTPIRSTVPHGVLNRVETAAAEGTPGVVAVHTGETFAHLRMPANADGQPEITRRPLIATDRVRFVGDIVAVVLAETERQATDAADRVWPEIDPLPAVVSPERALQDGPLLFPELGTNLIFDEGLEPAPNVLDDAEVVVEASITHQRMAAVPLEPNGALAVPREDGGLDLWVGSQSVHAHRGAIAAALGIDRALLHVKVPDMGGGFGAKIVAYPEQALAAALAFQHGRPVRWAETRTENLRSMSHGRAQIHVVALGARRDGTITGLRVRLLQDAGAYPLFGARLPTMTQRMAAGAYRIPKIDYRWRSVVTNTTPVHAYRGAGRPEAALTIERMMDLLAAELGLDPVEIRRRNLIPADAFPHVTATGERYDSGDYEAALDLALTTAGYDELRAEQHRRRQSGDRRQLGIGVSSYVEVTAGLGRKDWGSVEVAEDGSVTAYSGSLSHGHSHATTFAQIISQVLRVPLDRIRLVQGDTDVVARGGGTMGSRSLQMGGTAVMRASTSVLEKARRIAAHHLEAALDDVVQFDDGRLGVAGVPDTGLTLAEVAGLAAHPANLPAGMDPGLSAEDTWAQAEATVPFGSHVSVIEVDTETGDVRVLRHVACDDAGRILNRMVVDGQVHGGVAQGIGQALLEGVLYDEDANLLTGNLASYLIPTATMIPAIRTDHTETPSPENALGAKGIGEAGTVGSIPAVVNAVIDAISPVRHLDMPLTPAKIWAAINR